MKPSKRNLIAVAMGSALSLGLSACAPQNPQRMAPPEVYAKGEQAAPITAKVEVKPKVDVLFIIDNSDSMNKHQENLKRNIDRFVEAFEANTSLDFHIGMTSIFDSVRFGPIVKTFNPVGLLYPLKDPAHPGEVVPGPKYITRAPGYNRILGESLKIGVIPRFADRKHKVDGGGPEFEESFSPIVGAMDGRNGDFIRPDAHLAVIMITDADDSSSILPSKMNDILYQAKGRDREAYSTYAVLALENCPQDPGGPPTHILDFIKQSEGHAYNLCDPHYGDKLAEVGRLIEKKASRRSKILLDAIPEDGTLKVTFAGTGEEVKGWQYDVELAAVVIPGDALTGQPADAQIAIDYTPIDGRRIGTVRVRAQSQQ